MTFLLLSENMECEVLDDFVSELIEEDSSEQELEFTTDNITENEYEPQCTCFYCFKNFEYHVDMLDHIEIEHFKFICDKCDKKYPTGKALKKHQKVSHLPKKFKCPLCEKIFARQDHCKDHVYTHSDKPLFPCKYEDCEKAFRQSVHLKQHERIHTGLNRKSCPICKESVVYLTKHMRTHMETKDHTCGSCNKSFTRRSYLLEHEKLHQGGALFVCDECKIEFKTSNGFYKHKRSKHNAEKYSCDFPNCVQVFNRKDNMMSHMRRVHKVEVKRVKVADVHLT